MFGQGVGTQSFLYLYYNVLYGDYIQKVVTFRIEEELDKKLADLSEKKIETKSDLIREALIEFVRKETELNEIRGIVAKKFAEGKISFDEVVKVLGYEDAKKIAFFVEIAERSFQEGL